jgi:hypothetical protein
MTNSKNFDALRSGCGVVLLLAAACSGESTTSDQSVSTGGTVAGAGTGSSVVTSGGSSATGTGVNSAGTRASSGGSGAAGTAGGGTSTLNAGTSGNTGVAGGAGDANAGGNAADGGSGAAGGASGAGGSGGRAVAGNSGGANAAAGSGGGSGPAAGSGGSNAASATFTEVYALFKTSCAGTTCHVGSSRGAGGLSMADQATAYMNLVNANAVSCQGAKRVVASDTVKSELVHTLQHTMLSGCARTPKMPDNKPMLPQADIDKVVSWVKAGAKND